MKLLLILLSLLPLSVFGQEMSDGTTSPQVEKTITLWQSLIPIIVPLVIFGLRQAIPRLPSKLVPWLAPLLGALIDILLNFMDLGDGKGAVGGVFGGLGTWVYEVTKGSLKHKTEPKYKIPSLIILIPFLFMGCATQTVTKTDKEGFTTTYKTTAFFNKTAFEGVSVDKTTKTTSNLLSVGSYGAESQADQLVNLLTTIFNAGLSAGAKGAVPVP